MSHGPRVPYFELAPEEFQNAVALSGLVKQSSLGMRLVELVFLRVSQINGCAFCIDMHWRALLDYGSEPREVNAVAGWREAPFFSDRERAALEWAERVNAIPNADLGDEAFARLQQHFSEEEIAKLTFAVCAIRTWNQLNVSLRNPIPV